MPKIRVTKELNVWTRRFTFFKKHLPQVCIEDGVKKVEQNYFWFEHYWEKYIVSASKGLTRLEWTDEQYYTDWCHQLSELLCVRFGDDNVQKQFNIHTPDSRKSLYEYAISKQSTPLATIEHYFGQTNEEYIGSILAKALGPLGFDIAKEHYIYYGEAIIANYTKSSSCGYLIMCITGEVIAKNYKYTIQDGVATFTSPTLTLTFNTGDTYA